MNEIESVLATIGLTSQESRIYLALLQIQEAKAGLICRKTGIASSNIYSIISSLIQKGLVHYRIQNNIKVFMPAPPESLNDLFLNKQEDLKKGEFQIQQIISRLKKEKVSEEPYSHYKYYEGYIGIKSMWHEINEKMSCDKELYVHAAKKESYNKFVDFYDKHHTLREKKKIKENLLLPVQDKALAQRRKNKLTSVRFAELENDAEWGIFGDYFFMQHITTDSPRAFLVKDAIFAQTFKQAFDKEWASAKSN